MIWGDSSWASKPWAGADISAGSTSYVITPSGGFTMAGTAPFLISKWISPTNGVIFSGSGLNSRTKIIPISGGVVFNGTGNMTSNTTPTSGQTGERTRVGAGT